MNDAKEYGFKEDYTGYSDYENRLVGKGQPKPKVVFTEKKAQRVVH